MITDVTVAPTHRRRGLMRRLMTENLDAAVAAGLPLAVLTASEGAIYQRFGFGPGDPRGAGAGRHLVPLPAAAYRPTTAVGWSWRTPDGVLARPRPATERHHAVTRGSLGRPAYYELVAPGYDWDAQDEDRKLRLAVRLDGEGEPDGYVAYTVKEEATRAEVKVHDLSRRRPRHTSRCGSSSPTSTSPRSSPHPAPAVDPLAHALVDHRVRRVTSVPDHLWVRILDVPAALEARPWFADGTLVLRVHDPWATPTAAVRIDASGGRASVTRTEDAPTSPSMSRPSARSTSATCRSTRWRAPAGSPAPTRPLARFAALADGSPSRFCATHF